jgi:hypothetical protein
MLASIYLDHEAGLEAREIDDVRTNRDLPTKPVTGDLIRP